MLQSRTDQEPEPHFHGTATDLAARDTEGQRLDDARETFRARWQEQIERKREQAERARNVSKRCANAPWKILGTGAVIGGICGLLISLAVEEDALIGNLITAAAMLGFGMALLPAVLVTAYAGYQEKRAERLERELRELELS